MDHDQAMPKLKQDRESLMKIKDVVAEAARTANTAISNHEKMKAAKEGKGACEVICEKKRTEETQEVKGRGIFTNIADILRQHGQHL